MYDFILGQWIMAIYTKTNIANCITKKYISQTQADTILATPQISVHQ